MADQPDRNGTKEGEQASPSLVQPDIALSKQEEGIHLERPSLKEQVATQVLRLFSIALLGTLVFAGILVLIDTCFIALRIIKPDERLMKDHIIMTFVTATVVQVGAAVAAIVFAVFKSEPSDKSSRS